MNSIRQTIQAVFTDSKNGLKGNMVIGPVDVTKNNYDILLVDESHRLHKRRFPIPDFDEACNRVGMDPHNVNALDWIVKCSKHRVLFYDQNQTIKGSDITHQEFEKSIEGTNIIRFNLTSQMRCKGGQLYIDYLNSIFNCACESFLEMDNDYDVKIFDNPNKMINKIKQLDGKYKLCRNVAGYSWKWKTKDKKKEKIEQEGLFDIDLNGGKYIWNMKYDKWILSEGSTNEIGCVHTTQGYDLNYVGVILGEEIDYDEKNNIITIDAEKFFDSGVKKNNTPDKLKQHIINAYKVMMSRGIKGCYVYACNENMRNYLKKFFPTAR